jgi:hypothetical protein
MNINDVQIAMRALNLDGVRTAQREQNMNASYDYSVLDKCWPQLRMFETLWKGVELLVVEGPKAERWSSRS